MEGSISYQDLSLEVERLTGTKTSPFDLRRLLRLAVCSNIFAEQQPGYISHNRTSLLFLEDESIMGWVGLYTTDLLLPVANTVPAMRKWPCSQESNETVSWNASETPPPYPGRMFNADISGREHYFQPFIALL